MQNGRNNRLDGRVPIPINRGSIGYATKIAVKNPEIERRKMQENRRREEEAGKSVGASVVNLPDEGKIGGGTKKFGNPSNIPTKARGKAARSEGNRVSQSIRKLLSEFESGERSNLGKPKIGDDRKLKANVKTIRLDRPAVEKSGGRSTRPAASDERKTSGSEAGVEFPTRKIPVRKNSSAREGSSAKIVKSQAESLAESMVVSGVGRGEKNSVARGETQSTDQLVPIVTPEGHVQKSVNLINSIISSYLEEKPEDRRLDFLLAGTGAGGSVFPVCSKRATDNIPTSEVTSLVRDGRMPDKTDLIIMLRRGNSEPYPTKNYLLQSHADCENPTWKLDPVENYYFWESAPTRPYWEVSLIKTNRSLSALTSRVASGMLSLTPASDSAEILQPGRFSSRKKVAEAKPSWVREISSVADENKIQTMPFVTLMEKGRIIPREPRIEKPVKERPISPNPPRRILSKDDNYNPPGHLLVYVKSSQKKLVTAEGRNRQSENSRNRKIHKIGKFRGINSEMVSRVSSSSSWDKKIFTRATTAFTMIIGAFLLLLYLLARPNSYSNLTPPIPGLVRGC